MTCIKTGAIVHVLCYDLIFAADLFEVAGAIVAKANGPLREGVNAVKAAEARGAGYGKPTHILRDTPGGGDFWRKDLGTFVVPKAQCVEGVI